MPSMEMTRRAFVGSMAAARLSAAGDGWTDLFDGRSLQGWKAGENPESWKVEGGQLLAGGPRSHLF